MRVHFDLQDPFEPFRIEFEGVSYPFASLQPLGRKERLKTNISEFVYRLPTGKYVYVTIVGDEDQTSGYGVARGWYVIEELPEADAKWLIDAMKPFTDMYKP